MKNNPFDPRRRQRRFGDPDLTRRILDQTSGPACARAEQLLGGRWDGELERVDAELLAAHLARCGDCRALAAALERLQPLLPLLAEREPGPAFTAAVLAATSRRQAATGREPLTQIAPRPRLATAASLTLLEHWAGRLQRSVRRAWERPRFALEAAWAAAAVATLLLFSPMAPAGAPARAPAQVGQAVQAGVDIVPELVARIHGLAVVVQSEGRGRLAPAVARVRSLAGEVRRYLTLASAVLRADEPGSADRNEAPTTGGVDGRSDDDRP
ncbi:MAG: zf-HC2 domain-containing protein [Candidatus Krumholzibacteria bacterium]|jgi:hypothetical protein|nr:zf-HC2 domain-containing protein [Candidatus Krumholzibacteria bacterium]